MATAPTLTTDDEPEDATVEPEEAPRASRPRRGSKLRIVEDWKGMPALLDGERLVTRSSNMENLQRMLEKAETSGKRPFSSKVAPVQDPEDEDVD